MPPVRYEWLGGARRRELVARPSGRAPASRFEPQGEVGSLASGTVVEDALALELVAGESLGLAHVHFEPDPEVGPKVLCEPVTQAGGVRRGGCRFNFDE